MFCWLQRRWLLAASLSLTTGLLLLASPARADRAEDKGTFKRVKFQTVDSVEIQGTFYPNNGAKRKDTCVLLLHAIHPRNGGTSHDGSWDAFAVQMQKAGYDVLSFDFRGFGNSTSVGPEFWDGMKFPYNQQIRNARKKPESISFKDFPNHYYPNLANDVAAARNYLNERGDVNTSNLVIVGAGEGATLGLLWMASECRLQRDSAWDQPIRFAPPMLDPDPEGRDLACAIWLNISPTLANGNIMVPLGTLARDVARKGKVRMAFVASKNDQAATTMSRRFVEAINQGITKNRLATTYEVRGANKLAGSQLLSDDLDTSKWIVDECLSTVLDARGSRDRRKHDMEKYGYFWVFPWPNEASAHPLVAKEPKEIMLKPLPVGALLGRGG